MLKKYILSPQENLEHKNRVIRIPLFDVVAEHQGELPLNQIFLKILLFALQHIEKEILVT